MPLIMNSFRIFLKKCNVFQFQIAEDAGDLPQRAIEVRLISRLFHSEESRSITSVGLF
jgi:hypothetical protein